MRSWIALSIGLVALAGCKQPASDHPAVTQAEAAKIAAQAESNFTAGNVDAVMRQYADGAVMFDATHPGFTTDRKVQTGWAKDFVSMKPANYQVPDRQIQIVGPDAFISSGTEMYAVTSGTASPTRQMYGFRRSRKRPKRVTMDIATIRRWFSSPQN